MRIRVLTWRVVAALAVIGLVAAACNKGNDNSSAAGGTSTAGSSSSTTGTSGASGSSGASGGSSSGYGRYGGGGNGSNGDSGSMGSGDNGGGNEEIDITANDFAFDPTSFSVKSGAELYLKNANANTPHTFTIDGTDVDVSLEPLKTEDIEIDLDPGTYDWHCKIHPQMTGTLTVT